MQYNNYKIIIVIVILLFFIFLLSTTIENFYSVYYDSNLDKIDYNKFKINPRDIVYSANGFYPNPYKKI